MVVADDFPIGRRLRKYFVEPFVLFGFRTHILVGVEHEKFGVAVAEFVKILWLGKCHIVVIISRINFVISEDREKGNTADQRVHCLLYTSDAADE